MIVEKIAYFKCDWCGKEGQSEISSSSDFVAAIADRLTGTRNCSAALLLSSLT